MAVPEQAAPCDFEQLGSALVAKVPGVVVVPGAIGARPGDVAIRFSTGKDNWELYVAAAGAPELRRELPAPGTECSAFAETSALIVERYLESIAWTPEPAVVTPLPPPPTPVPWEVGLEVGLGGYLRFNPVLGGPSAMLGVFARHGHLQLGFDVSSVFLASVALSSSDPNDPPTTGQLRNWPIDLAVAAGYRLALPFGTLEGDLLPGAELTLAQTSSNPNSPLFGATDALIAAPDLAFSLGYEIPIWRRLTLCAFLTARALFARTEFSAPGENGAFASPWVDGEAQIRARILF